MGNRGEFAGTQTQASCQYCQNLVDDMKNGIKTPEGLGIPRHGGFQCPRCNTVWDASLGSIFLPTAYVALTQRYAAMVDKRHEFTRWGIAYALCNKIINGMEVLAHDVRMAMLNSAIVMYFSPMSGGRTDRLREAVMEELSTIGTHSYVAAFCFFRDIRHKYIAHMSDTYSSYFPKKDSMPGAQVHVPNFVPHGIKYIVFHTPTMKTFDLGYAESFRSLVDVTMRIMFFKHDGTESTFRNLNLLPQLRRGHPSNLFQQEGEGHHTSGT